MKEKRRFILIDNALESLAGHFYEYDISVLAQIPKAEYETLLFSNIDAVEEIGEISTPFFQCNFWAPSKKRRRVRSPVNRPSPSPVDSRSRDGMGASAEAAEESEAAGSPEEPEVLPPLFSVDRLIHVGRRVNRKYGHTKIFRFFQPLINRIYWRVQVGRMRQTPVDAEGLFKEKSVEKKKIKLPIELNEIDCNLRDIFHADLEELFEKNGFGPDDVVFFPNMNHWGLASILNLVKARGCDNLPFMKLLLRRNIFVGKPTPQQYHSDNYYIRVFKALFEHFEDYIESDRFAFFSDTERLKDEYEVFSPFEFKVVPIPFRHDYIRRKKEPGDPLRVVYMGTARSEKGFQYIPDLVDRMRPHIEAGEVEFVLQAVPDPEPMIQEAVKNLRARPGVTLLEEPLDDRDYYGLLNSGDIMLLLYDPVNYYSRSSCIFVESMISGTPFITLDGSWMAHVMAPGTGEVVRKTGELFRALESIVNHYEDYREAIHEAGLEWEKYHNAENLVEVLLDSRSRDVVTSE
jgi:hypothetical protein